MRIRKAILKSRKNEFFIKFMYSLIFASVCDKMIIINLMFIKEKELEND